MPHQTSSTSRYTGVCVWIHLSISQSTFHSHIRERSHSELHNNAFPVCLSRGCNPPLLAVNNGPGRGSADHLSHFTLALLKSTLSWRLLFSQDNRTRASTKSALEQFKPDWEQFKTSPDTAKRAADQVPQSWINTLVLLNAENTGTISLLLLLAVIGLLANRRNKIICVSLSPRTAMWKQNSAGLHRGTVFTNRLTGSLPATEERLLLHLDPCCGIYPRWAQRKS